MKPIKATKDHFDKLKEIKTPDHTEADMDFKNDDWKGKVIVFHNGEPLLGFGSSEFLPGNPILDNFKAEDGFELVQL
jgi:hypothetical protein